MKKTRILILPLSALLVVSLTSCKKKGMSHDVDGKAIINIANYDGGVGYDWINTIVNRLNSEFADYQDDTLKANGLKGVYFNVDTNTSYYGQKLESGGLIADIYFTEMVDYAFLARKGLFLDVSDVIKESLEEFGDTGSIEDKLDPSMRAYLQCINDKYYGLPFYEGFYNMIYDVDVFDANGAFFDRDGNLGETSASDNLSVGPDNVEGTWDDGLPRTYAEFDMLMDSLSGSYTNIALAKNALAYSNRYLQNLYVNYEGKEQTLLNYTFNGTAQNLVDSFDGSGDPVISSRAINSYADGVELQRQAGKYYALDFMEKHLLNGNLITGGTDIEIFKDFINTKYGGASKLNSYACMIDGSWWENKAKSTLQSDEARGGGKLNRRFGILPAPKVDASELGKKQTCVSLNSAFCFVSANTVYPQLAKKVFKAFHTQQSLSTFTSSTSMTRAFNYTLTTEDLANTSYFAKQLIDMKNTYDVVYPVSSVTQAINKKSDFNMEKYPWSISAYISNPFNELLNNRETAVSYFQKMYTYAKGWWGQ